MFCKNCGNRISERDVFCQNCGMKIKWESGDIENASASSCTVKRSERKHNKDQRVSAVIFGIIGVVIVILIGGIGWGGYTLYKFNRDMDEVTVLGTNDDTDVSEKMAREIDFDYLVEISDDTSAGVHIGYNSDSILGSMTLIYENKGDILKRGRGASDFIAAEASSSLEPTSHSTYYPDHVLDGDKNTAWIEGAAGFGEGEWIELSAESVHKVYGLCIRNGYTKEEKRLIKNAQANRVQVVFSDKISYEYELEESKDPNQECLNVILFTSGPVETDKIRIKILSVYESQDYVDPYTGEIFARDLDTAISDIYVLQWDEEKDMKNEKTENDIGCDDNNGICPGCNSCSGASYVLSSKKI